MNDRIKELAKTAGYEVDYEKTRSGDFVEFDDFKAFNLEKFTELLIKECVESVISVRVDCDNEHWQAAIDVASQRLENILE